MEDMNAAKPMLNISKYMYIYIYTYIVIYIQNSYDNKCCLLRTYLKTRSENRLFKNIQDTVPQFVPNKKVSLKEPQPMHTTPVTNQT